MLSFMQIRSPILQCITDTIRRLMEEAEVIDKRRNELPHSIRDLLNEEHSMDGVFSLSELIAVLRAERAADIVCISVPPSEGPYHNIVICSPQNRRHGEALVQTIRKCLKVKCNLEETEMQRTVKSTGGWYCITMGNTVLHVMTPEARRKYNLEALWGLGCKESDDEEDAEDLIPRPM
uniref:Ribosomal silencing factor RsfS n=1 Tax=Parascaris univalens TaxID=6257 RepID=A0A915C2G6_PARUN